MFCCHLCLMRFGGGQGNKATSGPSCITTLGSNAREGDYQWLHGAQLLDLVPTQVQVRQVRTFLCQRVQTS